MEIKFKLHNLNCPNCSAKIENETGKIKGVESSVLNLIKQTLVINLSDNFQGDIFAEIEKIVHKHEPDVKVTVIEDKHNHKHDDCGDGEHHHEHCHHEHGEHCHHEHGEHHHEHCCHEHGEHHHEHCHHEHGEHCHHEHGEHNNQHSKHHHKNSGDHTHTMKFLLKGLNCPNCSAKIENDAGNIKGIEYSSLNLIKQTLTLEVSHDHKGNLLDDVTAVVHKHEPDIPVSYINEEETETKTENKQQKDDIKSENQKRIIKFITGTFIYLCGIIVKNYIVPQTAPLNLLPIGILIISYIVLGGDVVLKALKNIIRGRIFDENFLMTLSTAGAFIIGEYDEAVAVMLFYQVGEFFQDLAVQRSRNSIADLMDIRPEYANVERDGQIVKVSPEEVLEGEIIVVKAGEKVPLDSIITEGVSALDTRALTGESLPRNVEKGDTALSGCINNSGVLKMKVIKTSSDSTVSKIIDLVENASSRKAPAENFISVFARYYTPIVVILAVLLTAVPVLFLGGSFKDYILRSFVFLVISCPCALVISIPLTFFGGIGAASKNGILVKGGNYLELLSKIDTIVFDKTGTLTKGDFTVTDIIPEKGVSENELLEITAYAEMFSNHPIARSIISKYGSVPDENTISDYKEISGNGVSAVINGNTIIAGNEKLMKQYNISFTENDCIGTKIYTAKNNKYIGCIVIADEVKKDSRSAIENLKKAGIEKTVMLTGDNKKIADNIGENLGIDIVMSELLPDQKVMEFEKLFEDHSQNKKIAFVGDGINDAPVLARADVGIAMGGLGSDAAIEAADVILMTDEPSKLLDAVKISKATKAIVTQNIVFAIGVKVLFLILGAFGIANMWYAVFGDVGVMIIAVLNAMRILRK